MGKTYTYELQDKNGRKVASASVTYDPAAYPFQPFTYLGDKIMGKDAILEWRSPRNMDSWSIEIYSAKNKTDRLQPVSMSASATIRVQMSAIAHLERIKAEITEKNTIKLSWVKPTSTRVQKIKLFRIADTEGAPELLSTLNADRNKYEDKQVNADHFYRYFVRYQFTGGEESESCPPVSVRIEE